MADKEVALYFCSLGILAFAVDARSFSSRFILDSGDKHQGESSVARLEIYSSFQVEGVANSSPSTKSLESEGNNFLWAAPELCSWTLAFFKSYF